jgi:hypothetical protein
MANEESTKTAQTRRKQEREANEAHANQEGDRLGLDHLNWREECGDLVLKLIAVAAGLGHYLAFSTTSDGGAVVIMILKGTRKRKWYARSLDEFAEMSRAAIAFVRAD